MIFSNREEIFKVILEFREQIDKMKTEDHYDTVEAIEAQMYLMEYQWRVRSIVEMIRPYCLYEDVLDKIDDEKSRFLLESAWRKHTRMVMEVLEDFATENESSRYVYDKNLIEIEKRCLM